MIPPQTKKEVELTFQLHWQMFNEQDINSKVREYWKKYRYLDEILAFIKLEDQRVLDIGCGVVSVLHILESGYKIGIDPLFKEYYKIYGGYVYGNILGINACGERLPFKDCSFDVVFVSNVLDHVESPNEVVSEVNRVLKSQGKFVITVDVFDVKGARDAAHPHCFEEKDLYLLLRDFRIRCSKKSESRAQVYNYFVNKMAKSKHVREQIVIAERIE